MPQPPAAAPATRPTGPCSAAQWQQIRQAVLAEARRACVAGSFLPLVGPLGEAVDYVAMPLLLAPGTDGVGGFSVDDTGSWRLATLQTEVWLRDAQLADPRLASALLAFRRAAQVLARLADDLIFNGQLGPDQGPAAGAGPSAGQPDGDAGVPPWQVRGGQASAGLLPAPMPMLMPMPAGEPARRAGEPRDRAALGESLVGRVSRAIGRLEADYHLGPFACVLDPIFYTAVQSPDRHSMRLAQDRILPLLAGGPLLRSSSLAPRSGVVVALGGAPIDLVVGTDTAVEFVQQTEQAWYVFRVFAKGVLRIKQASAVQALGLAARPG